MEINLRYCMHCLDPISGRIADFVYEGEPDNRKPVSPLFDDVGQLFIWMRVRGWQFHIPGEEDKFKVIRRVNVQSHHNAEGKLYMPSQPWGIEYFLPDMPTDNLRANSTDGATSKKNAISKAMLHVTKNRDTVATIFRRSDGAIATHILSNGTRLLFEEGELGK